MNNDQVIVLQRPGQLLGRFQSESGEARPSFRFYIDDLEKVLGKMLTAQIQAVSVAPTFRLPVETA